MRHFFCIIGVCSLVLGAGFVRAADDVQTARPDQVREIQATADSQVAPRPAVTIASQTLKVVSWNIDRGTGLVAIAAELRARPADLLLLQEVDWNTRRTGRADVASELAKRLGMSGVFAIEFEELGQESGAKAYTGQATLSWLPIRAPRILRFRHQSQFWRAQAWLPSSVPLFQRRRGERMALVTELTFSGKPLVVYNVHLESRSYGRIQMEQLDEVLTDAKRYPRNTSILLAGDLNTKYLPSLYLKKLQRMGFHSCLGDRIERTHAIMMALDWIFAKGPLIVQNGSVRKDSKGSDHYPICAVLE